MEQASDLKIAQEAELWPVQSVAEAEMCIRDRHSGMQRAAFQYRSKRENCV